MGYSNWYSHQCIFTIEIVSFPFAMLIFPNLFPRILPRTHKHMDTSNIPHINWIVSHSSIAYKLSVGLRSPRVALSFDWLFAAAVIFIDRSNRTKTITPKKNKKKKNKNKFNWPHKTEQFQSIDSSPINFWFLWCNLPPFDKQLVATIC